MNYLNWSLKKNEILKAKRRISFEQIAFLIESGHILDIEENPTRPNQNMVVLESEYFEKR